MRLWLTRPLPQPVMARAAAAFDCTCRESTSPLDAEELRRGLRDFDIVMPTLGDAYGADVFADVPDPRCRLLANFGVGYNHIDAVAARAAGLAVTNTPGAVTDATADLAMTLLLMTARRAGEGERLVRSGGWAGWHPMQLLGRHMTGKTVGIVGMGRIGQAIARRCHFGFGMRVLYHTRSPRRLDFPADPVADLATLASAVDALVIAVPGGPDTHHLIGARILAAMRPHAILVNIARGDVVDEAALIEVLARDGIAGAGLDVYEFEPHVPEALLVRENVTLLPHLGTNTEEVRTAMGHMVLDNACAFAAGQPLPNPVPEAG